jgi:predicted chitinase
MTRKTQLLYTSQALEQVWSGWLAVPRNRRANTGRADNIVNRDTVTHLGNSWIETLSAGEGLAPAPGSLM